MISKPWILCLIAVDIVLWLGAIFWPVSRSETKPMSVVVGLWPGSETLLMAQARKELPPRQITLVEMTWTSAAVRAFQNGVADAAVLSLGEVIHLKENGCDVRIVLVLDSSRGADAILVRPGLRSLADLKGKRIAMTSRSSGLYIFSHEREKAGLKDEDFTMVPLNSTEAETAYASGEVDAAVINEPWATKLVNQGAVRIADSKPYEQDIYRVVAVRTEKLAEFEQALQVLVKAHFHSLEAIQHLAPRDPVLAINAKREGVSIQDLQAMFKLLDQPSAEQNKVLLEPETGPICQAATRVAQYMLEHGMIEKAVDCRHLTDPTFVRQVP